MKVLVVVDMQKDIITGMLGKPQAKALVEPVAERIKKARANGEKLIFLRDTREEDYLDTQEGKRFRIMHNIRGTDGWQMVDEIDSLSNGEIVIDKPTFGSVVLGETLRELDAKETVEEITFIGIYLDMCVMNNALLSKAFLPEAHIVVDASLTCGMSEERGNIALSALRTCLVDIIND